MQHSRRAVLGSVAGAIAFAGCAGGTGGDDDATDTEGTTTGEGTTATTESTGTTSDGGAAATVRVTDHPDLGKILVGAEGMTLYMFDEDAKGSGESACSGDCADAWPPLTVTGAPSAGSGVTASLDTFERSGGETQVTANGWPLYYYAPDESAGDATGQGVGGVWWVLGPDGTPIEGGEAGTDAGTTTSSGPY